MIVNKNGVVGGIGGRCNALLASIVVILLVVIVQYISLYNISLWKRKHYNIIVVLNANNGCIDGATMYCNALLIHITPFFCVGFCFGFFLADK